ncbi:hypothetical protein FB470_003638 [Amycolatopsis thermophila]|uniref:Uncharacterized protein n=1 Tax=Amycolatopsis thermophila TaxID=206084 RepID=A0ABU0EX06_9PSEU|nr:hypothetical protein [Amycolatopsis thermophila]MDQ0379644.1 hypothetical protein [Amycolatopsis thermophila]
MVKHGNRSASSACSSADVLEKPGVVLDPSPGTSGIAAATPPTTPGCPATFATWFGTRNPSHRIFA